MQNYIAEFPIDQIKCKPQVRTQFDEESLRGLAQSIREGGVLQPLLVRSDGVLVDGERRFRAAVMADATTVPVLIEDEKLDDGDVISRQLTANCQREDLNPMEVARAARDMIETKGLSAEEAARKLGFSPAKLSRALALLTLPESIQGLVEAGKLTASSAYQISLVDDPGRQQELAEETVAGRLSRETVRRHAKPRAKGAARRHSKAGAGNPRSRLSISVGPGCSLVVRNCDAELGTVITFLSAFLNELSELPADTPCKAIRGSLAAKQPP